MSTTRPIRKKVDPRLSSARAYWRLAWKARRAGNYKQGEGYQQAGDRLYQTYRREQDRREAAKAAEAAYWAKVRAEKTQPKEPS